MDASTGMRYLTYRKGATRGKYMKINAKVTYRDINLRDYRGTLLFIGHTPHGGDCTVRWSRPIDVTGAQCLDNLMTICPQCQYPHDTPGCPNPACPQDKDAEQLLLIHAAQEARKAAARYDAQHKGIDYSLSFTKKEKP